jgi:Uma2 family endonuclease
LPHHLVLPPDLRLTPEQFALVCEANPEAVLELAADGQLIAMTPTGGDTSARNSLLIARLQIWALGEQTWKVFDSSGGFRLLDGSVLSPDAGVVRAERWQAETEGPVPGPRRLEPASRLEGGTLFPTLVLDLEESWAS